jgi:hypothetical protein
MKWLYHSVAKEIWNHDRRLWRIFTPLVSLTLSLGVIAIVNSHLLGVFDPTLVSSDSRAAALGFLVGLFSDNTVAKLAEVAESIFGTTRRGGPKPPHGHVQPEQNNHETVPESDDQHGS